MDLRDSLTTRTEKLRHWVSSLRHVSLHALRPYGGESDYLYDRDPAADSIDTIPPLPAWLKWTFLALAATKLALVAALPVQALSSARYDDALFVRLAVQLSSGHWLGPYDQLKLLKGPMFPIFISLCHAVGLPLKLGEHLIYILFCVVLIRAIRPLRLRPWVLLVLFTSVLFDPVWMCARRIEQRARIFLHGPHGAGCSPLPSAWRCGVTCRCGQRTWAWASASVCSASG